APVWTVLYLAMAIAAWRVWRRVGVDGRRIALLMFGLQLSLNLYWSYLFFGTQMIGLALAELIVLLGAIAVTWRQFHAIDRLAGILFVPYVAWVAFAAVLNAWIFALN
ncbi:MAG: TspO/MBR family protein, partial [Casimicrobiaceae bacterium]